jgi:hypothetical protein
MIGRKSVIGIAVLCAFAFSAIAAATAAAEQQAYTCSSSAATKSFSDAHCKPGSTGTAFGHTFIANGTVTTITGSNAKTAFSTEAAQGTILKGQLSGVATSLQCTGLTFHGTLTNSAGPPTSVTGTGIIKYMGCTITAPVGKSCIIGGGGTIETTELTATTLGAAASTLKFAPASGTKFASIPIEGCNENVPPNANWPLTGAFTASISGATITTTHAGTTTQNTLKFAGTKAGIEGALTISMAEGSTPTVTAGQAITLT